MAVLMKKNGSLVPVGLSVPVSVGITPTGNINITTTSQVNVTNYATAQVVDSNLTAGNIKNGVSILGVQGTALVTTITVNQDNSIDLTIA